MTFNGYLNDFLFHAYLPRSEWWVDLIRIVIRVLLPVFFILLIVPLLVWVERRLLGFMQQRLGPNRVGPGGVLQTIADGIKLLLKEDIIPTKADRLLYIMAPMVMLVPALVTGGVIPWSGSKLWGAAAPNVNVGVLWLLAWSSLAVYGVVLAGWSSNNKYALLGGLRSSAQMISYEIGMGLAIITVALLSGSLGMQDIVQNQGVYQTALGLPPWTCFQYFPIGFTAAMIYCIAGVAETNRAPFDLPEAETELVAGYHTEYTSMKFAIFFMAEYANMVVVSAIGATLFFGGWWGPLTWLNGFLGPLTGPFWLVAKIFVGLYVFIWIRATLPRLRYDMLMEFGWKCLLPLSLGNLLCLAVALTFGYLAGLATWIVVAIITLIIVLNLRSVKRFTTKVTRTRTIRLTQGAESYSGAQDNRGIGSEPVADDRPSEVGATV